MGVDIGGFGDSKESVTNYMQKMPHLSLGFSNHAVMLFMLCYASYAW